jgi:hypothetical protein
MSALRDEIRAILREEIAALRADMAAPAPRRQVERVRITSSAELNRFTQELMRRANEPDFAARVARGDLVFELASEPAPIAGAMVTSPPKREPERVEKALITERDISDLGSGVRSLRIAPHSKLTPLARDEARRRGIRIERTDR